MIAMGTGTRVKAVCALLAAEAVLFIVFTALGVAARSPFAAPAVRLQWASMLLVPALCALAAGPSGRRSRDFRLLMSALLLSAANETMMLFFWVGPLPFIAVYAAVQAVYVFRHGRGKGPGRIFLMAALPLWAVLAVGLVIAGAIPADPALIAGGSAYGCLLTAGLASVWRNPNPHTARWGMTLFACCDVCLALYYALGFAFLPGILVWAFFLPSQILLALSVPDGNLPMPGAMTSALSIHLVNQGKK